MSSAPSSTPARWCGSPCARTPTAPDRTRAPRSERTRRGSAPHKARLGPYRARLGPARGAARGGLRSGGMTSDRAGTPAQPSDLVDVAHLVTAYYTGEPDPTDPAQRVTFGTS